MGVVVVAAITAVLYFGGFGSRVAGAARGVARGFGVGSSSDSGFGHTYDEGGGEYRDDDNFWRSHRSSHRLGTNYDEGLDARHRALGHHR